MSKVATLAVSRPRVAAQQRPMDLVAAEEAAAVFLEALGLPVDCPGMLDTPRRMAHAYAEMVTVPCFDLTTFSNTEKYDELVVVEDIPVRSKFARTVDFFAQRPQTQERLTKLIADHLQVQLGPRGVGVVISAEHSCMTLRGVRATGARTVTSALYGSLRDDPAGRAEFLSLTRDRKEVAR